MNFAFDTVYSAGAPNKEDSTANGTVVGGGGIHANCHDFSVKIPLYYCLPRLHASHLLFTNSAIDYIIAR